MAKILLVVPEAPAQQVAAELEQRSIKGKGLRLGVLDNSKSNADHLLRMLIEGVKAQTEVASVVSMRKRSVSEPAHSEVLDQLAREADLVVTAMAD